MAKCFYCNKEIPEEELEGHEIQCASNFGDSNIDFSNMIPCEICNDLINFSEYQEHLNTCGIRRRRRRNQNFLRFFEEFDENIQIPIPTPQVQGGITILNELNNLFTNLPNTDLSNINVPTVNPSIIEQENQNEENNTPIQLNEELIQNDNVEINTEINDDTSDDDMPELIHSDSNEDLDENNIEETENTIQNNQDSIYNLINSYYSTIYNIPYQGNLSNINNLNNINLNSNVTENIVNENQSSIENQENEELNINSLMSELNSNIQILNNMTENGSVYINPTFHINRNQDEYERLMRLDENIVKKGIEISKFSKLKICEEELCCPICFDTFTKNTKILEFTCGHNFCEGCSEEWFKENVKCPVCSFEFNDKEVKL